MCEGQPSRQFLAGGLDHPPGVSEVTKLLLQAVDVSINALGHKGMRFGARLLILIRQRRIYVDVINPTSRHHSAYVTDIW